MTVRWFFAVALLVGLAAATANAGEPSSRVFHIGIVAALSRSSPLRIGCASWAMSKAAT